MIPLNTINYYVIINNKINKSFFYVKNKQNIKTNDDETFGNDFFFFDDD